MDIVHPLLRSEEDRPRFSTAPLEEWTDKIVRALSDGWHGTHLLGRSGDGKTEASVLLIRLWENWMPSRSPICRITIFHRSRTSDSNFYKHIQDALGLTQHSFSSPADRLKQIGGRIIEENLKFRSKRFFLVIDQAQLLHGDDYLFLANIDDYVAMHGHRIMCIFIHQTDDQTNSARNSALSLLSVDPMVARRFFFSWHRFRGLIGVSEIAGVLQQYGRSKFKGKTYFEEWAPGVAESGGQFEDIAPLFVDAVASIRNANKLPDDDPEIAMAIFEPSVVNLLTRIAAKNPEFRRFEVSHVKTALLESCYLVLDTVRRRQAGVILTPNGPSVLA